MLCLLDSEHTNNTFQIYHLDYLLDKEMEKDLTILLDSKRKVITMSKKMKRMTGGKKRITIIQINLRNSIID